MIGAARALVHALDPVLWARDGLGLELDPYQAEAVRARPRRALRCWGRQTGKSTVLAVEIVHEARFRPGSLCLVISPSERQSTETHAKILDLLDRLDAGRQTVDERSRTNVRLDNGSRIVALPGASEATIRGYSAPAIVALDEAARVADSVFHAITPSLATGGRLIACSTPAGRRGWFAEAWHQGSGAWHRSRIRSDDCPRVDPAFLEPERRTMGDRAFRQEYGAQFLEDGDALFDHQTIAQVLDPNVKPLFGPNGEANLPPAPGPELDPLVNAVGGAA
ncbi:MAG: phage terminase large subunit [Gemmatimonadota bacterium]